MKKTALCFVFVIILVCFTSCFGAYKTNKVMSEIPPKPDEPDIVDIPSEETEKITVTLYFPDNDVRYLHVETREIEVSKDKPVEAVVLEELFKGPESDELSPALDGENLVNSVTVSEGLCTVDFKNDFVVLNTGGTTRESFAIASIVNSLCELEDVESVKITIDGVENAVFGHTIIENSYKPFDELVEE